MKTSAKPRASAGKAAHEPEDLRNGQRPEGGRGKAQGEAAGLRDELRACQAELKRQKAEVQAAQDRVRTTLAQFRQAEEARHEGETRLRLALSVARMGYWRYEVVSGALRDSEGHGTFFGVSPEGRHWTLADVQPPVHPDDRATADLALRRTAAEGAPFDVTYRTVWPTGETRWLHSLGRLGLDSSGKPEHVYGVTQDITEFMQAQAARQESELQVAGMWLAAALASMSDAVFISDPEGRFSHFNDAFATFHRFKSKADCAKTLAEYAEILDVFMADGELAPLEQWAVPRALRGETGTNVEYILRRKDTGDTWVGSYNFAPIRNRDGVIVGSVVTGRDVTARKQVEKTLAQIETALRATFEQAAVGMARVTADGRWLQVNRRLCQIVGFTKDELLALTFKDITHPDDLDADLAFLRQVLAGEIETYSLEKRCIRKDRSTVWINLTVGLVRQADREPDYFISVVEDITERKQAEATLAHQLDELRRWHQATLGREGRVLELKKEINELATQAGRPTRYPSASEEGGQGWT